MTNHKEIVRLHERGVPQREIASIVRCSLTTVSKTLKAAKGRQVGSAELEKMEASQVSQLLFDPVDKVSSYYQPDFGYVEGQMRLPGVNLALLWSEYIRSCEAAGMRGYQYSQFANLYSKWRHGQGDYYAALVPAICG